MTYSDMVFAAMRSEREAQPWYDYLKQLKARRDAERELIKEWRRKRPGMADFEILTKYRKWLDENFPVPDLADSEEETTPTTPPEPLDLVQFVGDFFQMPRSKS